MLRSQKRGLARTRRFRNLCLCPPTWDLQEKRLKQLDGNRLQQGMHKQLSVIQVQPLFCCSLWMFVGLAAFLDSDTAFQFSRAYQSKTGSWLHVAKFQVRCRTVTGWEMQLTQVEESATGRCRRCGITLRRGRSGYLACRCKVLDTHISIVVTFKSC